RGRPALIPNPRSAPPCLICCTLVPVIGLTREAAQPRLTHGYDHKMRPVTPGVQGGNAETTPSASVAAVAIEFPPNQVGQTEALSGLTGFGGPQFDRFAASAGVQKR